MKWTPRTWKSYVKTIEWNRSQKLVLFEALNNNDNLLIEACAGSGKTTLLTGIVAQLPASKITEKGKKEYKVLFCTFNKHNIEELNNSGKLPKRVQARTAHQVAKGLLTSYLKRKNPEYSLIVDTNDEICRKICQRIATEFNCLYEEYEKDKKYEYAEIIYKYPVKKITELEKPLMAKYLFSLTVIYRQNLFLISEEEIEYYSHKYKILPEELVLNQGHYTAVKICLKSILNHLEYKFKYEQICNFNTMLWLIYQLEIKPFYKDLLIIDEAQDCNPSQQALYQKYTSNGTRIIGVGDPSQSIWGFLGSNAEAWVTFKSKFEAKCMTLEETYRCSKVVTELANHFKPITARRENREGIVKVIATEQIKDYLGEDNLILSRFNAPLIKWSLLLTEKKISNQIRGIEVGEKIINYIRSFSQDNNFNYEQCYQQTLVKLRKLKEDNQIKEREQLKDIYLAVHYCYRTLYKDAMSLSKWIKNIHKLFDTQDKNRTVRLSTIHRSKGDESENVFLLGSNQLPHNFTEEENNLVYVAITRSKCNLYLIPTLEQDYSKSDPQNLQQPLGGLQLPEKQLRQEIVFTV